jgi:uroporphyrinogen decarboxylase
MTSRQRVEAALRHQQPDRTPIFEYVLLSPVADQLLGRPLALSPQVWNALAAEKGVEVAARQIALDALDLAQLLGHDLVYVSPNPRGADRLSGSTHATEMNLDDPVEALRRRNEQHAAASPRRPDECLLVYVALYAEMARRGLDLPVLASAYAHGIWTDVALMQTLLLAPEVARAHFALATRDMLALLEQYHPFGIDMLGVGGDFAGTVPIISPAAYREFIVPEVRRVSQAAHAVGCWTANASDGNLWTVIEDFLFGCEVDGYLEIDMHARMDLRTLKRRYGDRITFFGNLDCGNTLSFGSPEDVRQHTLECLEAGWGGGGHILCASNAITAAVSARNYLSIVRAYRERFGLPPLEGRLAALAV